LLTVLAAASLPAPATAQQAAQASASSPVIDEIIVSARRRGDENLQDVSIAVSAFSGETLRESGIVDFAEIAARTPSFTFQEQIGNQQEVIVRGIGTLRLTGSAAEPSVGTFIDEVYIGRRGTATPPIFDLERAEVVRGPQGTLYGKNVVGGAVNLITARPSQEFSGRASISYGQYDALGGQDMYGVEAYVTGGLSDKVAGRLAAQYRENDGYSYNILRDEELDDNESFAVRGSLLFEPSNQLELRLTADFSHNEGGGQSRKPVDDPTIPGLGAALGGGLLSPNPRISESPWSQFEDRDVFGLIARADYKLQSGPTLTYLAAYRDGDFSGRYSLVGIASPPSLTDAANGQTETYEGITQDLRISSPDGPMRWVGGLYYLREETKVIDNSIATSFLAEGGEPGGIGDILDGEFIYDQTNVTTSYAVYGELNWDFAENLTLTAGARYTWDDKDYDHRTECLDYGLEPDFIICLAPLEDELWDITTSEDWSEFTPKLGLDWRVSVDALLYISAAKGFKGGGWQGKPGTEAAALVSYDPETAWTVEAGAKTEWAEQRVRVNLALFYTKFDDLQVEQLDDEGLTLIIDNAADAEIQGLEVEAVLAPTPALQFWFSGSYIDSEYKDFLDASGGDRSGNTLARTPEFMFNVGTSYETQVGDALLLRGRVEYSWQDDMFWGVENTVFEGSYGLLDARISLGSSDGRWQAALYGKNLTDELYSVDVIPFLGDVFTRYSPPRSYGLQLTTNF
jgi:iron complex outermembrane receptor protein